MSRINISDNTPNMDVVIAEKNNLELKSKDIAEIVVSVIKLYSKDLDELVYSINENIKQQDLDGLSDQELETYCLKLSSIMYLTAAGSELIGLKESLASAINKEEYNNKYSAATGTMADKKATAELESQSSMLVELIYDRAEKMISSKLEYATHLLGSIKRVLNRRVEQMKMNPSRTRFDGTQMEAQDE